MLPYQLSDNIKGCHVSLPPLVSTALPENKGGWQNTIYLIFVYQKESVIYRPLVSDLTRQIVGVAILLNHFIKPAVRKKFPSLTSLVIFVIKRVDDGRKSAI